MKNILSDMVRYEGVESASLVSLDGVLVFTASAEESQQTQPLSDRETQPIQTLAALVSGWVGQIMRAVGQLSWQNPYRYVLKATGKTLVVHAFDSSFLLLVTDPAIDPELTRSLMDHGVQQFMGHMQSGVAEAAPQAVSPNPPGLFPSQVSPTTGALAPDGSITESAGEG
ncbi:MAG: hypothetical protein KDB61_02530 [Planctomycetes bacterium]|nr:hypothetical protein [Planctomycetota bacterium]